MEAKIVSETSEVYFVSTTCLIARKNFIKCSRSKDFIQFNTAQILTEFLRRYVRWEQDKRVGH
jgi:hypothetical protein